MYSIVQIFGIKMYNNPIVINKYVYLPILEKVNNTLVFFNTNKNDILTSLIPYDKILSKINKKNTLILTSLWTSITILTIPIIYDLGKKDFFLQNNKEILSNISKWCRKVFLIEAKEKIKNFTPQSIKYYNGTSSFNKNETFGVSNSINIFDIISIVL